MGKNISRTVKLKKGYNLPIMGKAEPLLEVPGSSGLYALKPADFEGLTPRLTVKPGQAVKAGEPLFTDKYDPEVRFVSPVGGTVLAINRGERRRVLEVIVREDPDIGAVDFGKPAPESMEVSEIRTLMQQAGLWPFLRRRPYGTIARSGETPGNIFISCFDTAPLAPDYAFIHPQEERAFRTGLAVLARLTTGKIHIGMPAASAPFLEASPDTEITFYSGPHPAGNVGIQIHHTAPLNKGDVVWTLNPQDLLFIGRFFETGKVDFSRIIALAGSEVSRPRYFKTRLGAALGPLLNGNLKNGTRQRIISGNPLTGTRVLSDNFLSFYDSQVTVLPEGDYHEFLGWSKPRLEQFSLSHAYFSWLMPRKSYAPDTNLHGEERAYVMTGQYEKVLPMDILPVQLIKAILAEDIDKMEKLGIYEVIGEDLALCEFVCTSKIEVQKVLRKGINLMMKEMG